MTRPRWKFDDADDAFARWASAYMDWIYDEARPNQFLEPDKPQPPIPRLRNFTWRNPMPRLILDDAAPALALCHVCHHLVTLHDPCEAMPGGCRERDGDDDICGCEAVFSRPPTEMDISPECATAFSIRCPVCDRPVSRRV